MNKRLSYQRYDDNGEETMAGHLNQIRTVQFVFYEVDEENQNKHGNIIITNDVEEIVFDYLETILIEKQLKNSR